MTASNDTTLKLRIRSILWSQGYHCPLEFDLSHFGFEGENQEWKRISLTDIDVLGIRFNDDLSPSVVIADCKTGRESEANRVFWLKGVMLYFSAHEGMLVKTRVRPEARTVARKLGIRCVDTGGLQALEEALKVDRIGVAVGDPATQERAIRLWGIQVPKRGTPTEWQQQLKAVYQYLQYTYWMIEEYRNVQTLIDRFSLISDRLDPADERAKYLSFVGLQRLTLSIMQMASEVAARDATDVQNQTRLYLFGGAFQLRERRQTVERLNALASRNQLMSERIALEPSYFDEIVEIINKIISHSKSSRTILHHLDAAVIEGVLGGNFDIEKALGDEFSLDALVLLKRITNLFFVNSGIDRSMFTELMNV